VKGYVEYKDSGIKWMGQIPAHWNRCRVKNVFTRKNSKALQEDPIVLSLARSGVRVRDVSINEGQMAESYYNYNPVAVGDLLINPMDLYSGANCNLSEVEGVISPAYFNLRSRSGYSAKYFNYYFKIQYWTMAFFAHGKGVSQDNRWVLNSETLMAYPLIVPSKDEQDSIANYLNNETSKIDALIEGLEEQIGRLDVFRRETIANAVTKGIHRSCLKESGVDWIGKIPVNWTTTKTKFMFEIVKRIHGKDDRDVLSITQRGLKIKDVNVNDGQMAESYTNYQVVNVNDFAMNSMDLLTGWVDCSTFEGVTSPDYRVFRFLPDKPQCHTYYKYLFQMCYKNRIFYRLGQGVSNLGRWRLQTDQFLNMRLPQPPVDEQKQIAAYLDEKTTNIDILINDIAAQIEKLKQYRQIVIYDAVTGKKKVTGEEQKNGDTDQRENL
jgi:type I restriction enzyme S subunit